MESKYIRNFPWTSCLNIHELEEVYDIALTRKEEREDFLDRDDVFWMVRDNIAKKDPFEFILIDGTFCQIDAQIVTLIKLLNSTGHPTNYCCEGHAAQSRTKSKRPIGGYLSFVRREHDLFKALTEELDQPDLVLPEKEKREFACNFENPDFESKRRLQKFAKHNIKCYHLRDPYTKSLVNVLIEYGGRGFDDYCVRWYYLLDKKENANASITDLFINAINRLK